MYPPHGISPHYSKGWMGKGMNREVGETIFTRFPGLRPIVLRSYTQVFCR
jgi:hypothetical protein